METIKPDDVKARLLELPKVAVLQSDHRVLVDSPTVRGGVTDPIALVQRAHVDTPLTIGAPTIQGSVFVLDGGIVKRYNLAAAVGSENIWYLGPHPAPPTRTNNGLSLVPGYQYFNTGDKQVYIYVGSAATEGWQPYGVPYPANSQHYYFYLEIDAQQITGADEVGNVLSFDTAALDDVEVYVNGVKQILNADYVLLTGDTIQFMAVLFANCVIEVVVQKRIELDYTVTPFAVNTDIWVFDGTRRVFSMYKLGGGALVPGSSLNTLLSLNGTMLNPSRDYSVLGSDVTFLIAPTPGSTAWMTVGIPIVPDYLPDVLSLASHAGTDDQHGTFMDDGSGDPVTFQGE